MTWKELVNFVKHHEGDVEPESEVEFEKDNFDYGQIGEVVKFAPTIIPIKTIYFANATPCNKCNHKHNVVRLRSIFES